MDPNAKFIIKRIDIDRHLDGALLIRKCLLIGRHCDSDLVLDHSDILPAQAGIIYLDGSYWLCSLTQGVEVWFKGKPVKKPVRLNSGDELLMGPYHLEVNRSGGPLAITVKMYAATTTATATVGIILQNHIGARSPKRNLKTANASTLNVLNDLVDTRLTKINSKSQLEPDDPDAFLEKYQEKMPKDLKTALANNSQAKAQFEKRARAERDRCVIWIEQAGSHKERAERIEYLVASLADGLKFDQQVESNFISKATSAAKPEPPIRKKKASPHNWRPTFDLKEFRWKPIYIWTAILVTAIVVAGSYVHKRWYSPGPVAHDSLATAPAAPSTRNIAQMSNSISCADCHTDNIPNQCSSCHTTTDVKDQTTGKILKGFQPIVYDTHRREGMDCKSCHTEHKDQVKLINYEICASCHNATYQIKTGEKINQVLGVPHGGTVGYPVENGQWIWRGLSPKRWSQKNRRATFAKFSRMEQFHVLHSWRFRCTDCHTAGVNTEEGLHQSPRAECVNCHAVSFTLAGVKRGGANCSTCHQQHGQSRDMARLTSANELAEPNIKQYLAKLTAGQYKDEGVEADMPVVDRRAPQEAPVTTKVPLGLRLRLLVIGSLLGFTGIAFVVVRVIARRKASK